MKCLPISYRELFLIKGALECQINNLKITFTDGYEVSHPSEKYELLLEKLEAYDIDECEREILDFILQPILNA